MRCANLTVVVSLLLSAGAAAQTADPNASSPADPHFSQPTYEAGRTAEERAYFFKRQADEAEQLRRWCDTGFGPAECARRRTQTPTDSNGSSAPPAPSIPFSSGPVGLQVPSMSDAWSVSIVGWADKPTAWLRSPGAAEQRRAVVGATIVGWRVDAVKAESVHLSRPMRNKDGEPIIDEKGQERRETFTLLPTRTAAPPVGIAIGGNGGSANPTAPPPPIGPPSPSPGPASPGGPLSAGNGSLLQFPGQANPGGPPQR
jgi:hypothetical protein